MAKGRYIGMVRFGLPGLLGGLALSLILGGGGTPRVLGQVPPAPARNPLAPGSEANGTLAITSGTPGGAQWLYLIDTRSQAFVVYRIDPQNVKGTVKLEGARQYRHDLKLSEYNNQDPTVAAIESMTRTVK